MFEVIALKHQAKPPPVGAKDVTVSVRVGPSGRGHVLTIAMGQDVAVALKWSEGTPVLILWGTDRDAGKVKIWPQRNDGPTWPVRANKALDVFKIHTGALPEAFSGRTYRSVRVTHEVIKMSATGPAPFLVLSLPRDFFERGAS
ncbi:hypothetical protein [Roseospira navarrensis]|uniref:Uncharacterized protein n=1 Tax=Roseospira navarrensis TaxID=140058 RepID=A0A7X1ZE36_9PROT|nr:hypothetical protein [Roseospira navarrensis]MQX36845.1 hypothetical protein [Roseospira navarrensis]